MNKLTKKFQLQAFALSLMWLVPLSASAQTTTIKGSVCDEKGEPLIGVTVAVKGNKKAATVSDMDGNFVITVSSGKPTLIFSYVGMQDKQVTAVPGQRLKVVLKDDSELLEDVVVVGYGQQKKISVVGSITQTDAKTLERTGGVSSLGSALTGNLPGVITMSSSGMPGDEDPEIVIRGVSSWNNSQPLILVDGIERPMGSIDISSVQSISVLKDASATAVYGVKGANGVILITTKRGEEGKAKIEVNLNMTAKVVSKLPGKYDSANSLAMRNKAIENELGISPSSWSDITPRSVINKYANPANQEEAERYPNVDWTEELFNSSAMSYNPNVNISGGTKSVKYFASVDYLHEGDLYKEWDNNRGYSAGYGYDRINMRSNLDFQLTKTTKLKANLFGSCGAKKGPYGISSNTWAETQLWQAAYSTPPDVFLPQYSDGSWGYYPLDTQGATNSVTNLAMAGSSKTTTTRINTDFTLEQDLGFLLKGLRASATVSWDNVFVEENRGINDLYHDYQQKWIDPDTGEATYSQKLDGNTGFAFDDVPQWSTAEGEVNNSSTQRNLYYSAQLNWNRTFGKHDVSAMGMFSRQENTIGDYFTHYREDWAFRGTYSYNSRYFFEYNGCYNGSEQFGPNNRFAFFNSGAVGWLISEEKWFKPIKDSKIIDMLKVRYSYGEVGDDCTNLYGDNSTRWLYATQWAYTGTTYQGLYADSSPYTWYSESSVGNEDIHWEKAVKRNLGIDYSFLGGMFAGTMEFFNEHRNDILIDGSSRSIPSYFGATPAKANLGKVRSTGYELELRFNKVLNNKMRFWANMNMTHAVNKVTEYDDAELLPNYQKTTGYAINQTKTYLNNGFANTWDQVAAITTYNTNDASKLPGIYETIDYNADGVIDSNDSAPYGYTSTPQNTYSASIGFDWKGFSVYCQFYGVNNVTRYVGLNSLSGKLDTVYDEGTFWTQYTTDADAPMPRWNSTTSYYEGYKNYYDGSYIRLKNAEIAYTFTQSWVKSMGLTSLKVYLNGNNLWVWSRMPDDRESNFSGTGLASQGAYPTVRRFNLGIKINL